MEFLFTCQHRNGENAANGPQFSIKREFTDQQVVGKVVALEKTDASEDGDRQRKIESGSFFFDIGRREIDGDVLIGSGG